MMMDTKKKEKVGDRLPFPFSLQLQGYNDGTKQEEILTSCKDDDGTEKEEKVSDRLPFYKCKESCLTYLKKELWQARESDSFHLLWPYTPHKKSFPTWNREEDQDQAE